MGRSIRCVGEWQASEIVFRSYRGRRLSVIWSQGVLPSVHAMLYSANRAPFGEWRWIGCPKVGSSNLAGHFPALLVRRASTANPFKYSRSGRAGLPQKTTPLPRTVLWDKTPLPDPRMTPGSMVA